MKTYLLIVLSLFLILGCQKSDEKKAQDLIKAYIKENANDPDSYEPIEFESLDSMKTYYFTDKEYIRLEEERDNNIFLTDSLTPIMDSIRLNFKPELKGYMMRHKFRANNAFGAKIINKKVFRFNIDITEIISSDDTLD